MINFQSLDLFCYIFRHKYLFSQNHYLVLRAWKNDLKIISKLKTAIHLKRCTLNYGSYLEIPTTKGDLIVTGLLHERDDEKEYKDLNDFENKGKNEYLKEASELL